MNPKVLNEARDLISSFLQQRREELQLTQQELADLCGFHRNTIVNIEAGRFWPNMKQYLIIAHHLKCYPFLATYEGDNEYSKLMRKHWKPGDPGSSIRGEMGEN
jgi:DNA-binding XRE family transcriptional regulator